MATVAFKKGLLANLPTAYTEGTLYVTTDEGAIYLDVDGSTRVRIGDFQEFETLTALKENTNPSTTALYYVAELNCLAKYNGTDYIQINLDTGATSIEVVGTGNAVTKASYDPTTRKLTLTADATYTTSTDVDKQIAAKVGELKLGDESFDTVKEYVDKKTDGIATDTALEGLTGRVTSAEGKIDKLNGDKETEGSVAKTVDDAIKELDLDNTYDAKGAADAKDAAIAAAKKAGDDAQADVDVLAAKVGTVVEGKTVVGMIEEAKEAATYDDTELSGRVDTLVGADTGKSVRAISTEEANKAINDFATKVSDDGTVNSFKELVDWAAEHGSEAAEMAAAITAIQAVIAGIGGEGEQPTVVAYVADAIAALKIGDYAKAADLTALATRVTAAEDKLDTLTGDDTVDGSVAKALKDAKAYTDEKDEAMGTRVEAVEGKAHEHANKTVIDGITAAKVDAWDAAEQNAKNYADGLAGDYDEAGAADAAEQAAKEYTDTALTWGSF